VAFEVGFNSKSAFNRAFKKATHLTPSEFKKNHLNSVKSPKNGATF
jgi:AraC-like DNA-binding protein